MATGYGAIDKVSKTGDTMTGDLDLPGTPAGPLGAVPRQFVENGYVAVVEYTNGSWPERPVTAGIVLWIGPVKPPGAIDGDIWTNDAVSNTGGAASAPYVTDAQGGIWLLTVTATYPIDGPATLSTLPVLQDEANQVITDEAGGWLE